MTFLLLTLLFVKHQIFDFVYQPPYQYKNKGTYGHMGGVVHSLQHSIATFAILLFFTNPAIAFIIMGLEFVVHYHVDWAKMNINRIKEYTPENPKFWLWLGNDQLAHNLTYVFVAFIVYVI